MARAETVKGLSSPIVHRANARAFNLRGDGRSSQGTVIAANARAFGLRGENRSCQWTFIACRVKEVKGLPLPVDRHATAREFDFRGEGQNSQGAVIAY